MFTGIVEMVGKVVRVGAAPRRAPDAVPAHRLHVELNDLLADLRPGASVAVNGVCLTLVERSGTVGGFDVVSETWQATNLHDLRPGEPVNLERALRIGDRIDGHFVQGHVDGLGTVTRVDRAAGDCKLWVGAPPELRPLIVRKGSVALDGVSLTVVDAEADQFSVVLIPATLERTVLGRRGPGQVVNIETDILARLVAAHLAAVGIAGTPPAPERAGISFQDLREGGFL